MTETKDKEDTPFPIFQYPIVVEIEQNMLVIKLLRIQR